MMNCIKKTLVIHASPFYEKSKASNLIHELSCQIESSGKRNFIHRNLYETPLSFFDQQTILTLTHSKEDLNTNKKLELIDQLSSELANADTLVICTPTWNLNTPSILKCWIEHAFQQGKIFEITKAGVNYLKGPKRVILVSSSQADFSLPHLHHLDIQVNYLESYFHFIGIKEFNSFRFVSGEPTFLTNDFIQLLE